MIRNDIYTLYQGKEYEVISSIENGKRTYQLRSLDPDDLKNEFTIYKRPEYVLTRKGDKFYLPPRDPNEPDIYLKDISPSEVGEVFFIHTYAIYQGQKCSLEDEDDIHYFLRIEDKTLAQKLGFEIKDRDDFVKTVRKQDVESIFEEKTPIADYFE